MISDRGISLSGGQSQRIYIARAFLKVAPILILDEATSSLDNEADSDIKQTLKILSKGRTTIIIAHRLASLEDTENRLMFKNGKIIAMGQHDDLLKQSPDYFQLVNKDIND